MYLILTILVCLLAAILLFCKSKFNFWRNLNVPQFNTEFPYGNIKGVSKKIHLSEFVHKYYQKAKKLKANYIGIYFYLRPILMVTDLDLVKAILIKDFNTFPNRGFYYNEKDDPVSAHLFNLENEPWKILRQKLSPAFTSGKLKFMFKTIVDVSVELMHAIDKRLSESENFIEIKDVLARFTTDVIGTTAFGIDCNSLNDEGSKFYEFGTKSFTLVASPFKRFLRNTFKELARKLHIKAMSEEISSFYLSITKDTLVYREQNPDIKRQDFMDLLVDMKRQNILTVEQIAAQSFIFYLAGYETSSSTMTYCMYEFSINLKIQDKVRKSVREILMKHNNEYTYDAVNEMNYLEQCINETLRKYPVVPNLSRYSIHEYKLPNSNVTIPKNLQIFIPVYAIHHDPEIYPNPEQFEPDRFLPEEKEKRHPCSFIPFGEGKL